MNDKFSITVDLNFGGKKSWLKLYGSVLNFKVLVNNQVGILVLSCVCCHWSFLNNKFEMSAFS